MLARILEGVPQAAVHLGAGVEHVLHGHFVRRALHHDAADAGIEVAGVLADHDVVNVLRPLVLAAASPRRGRASPAAG